jgi:hypothetical protein
MNADSFVDSGTSPPQTYGYIYLITNLSQWEEVRRPKQRDTSPGQRSESMARHVARCGAEPARSASNRAILLTFLSHSLVRLCAHLTNPCSGFGPSFTWQEATTTARASRVFRASFHSSGFLGLIIFSINFSVRAATASSSLLAESFTVVPNIKWTTVKILKTKRSVGTK